MQDLLNQFIQLAGELESLVDLLEERRYSDDFPEYAVEFIDILENIESLVWAEIQDIQLQIGEVL